MPENNDEIVVVTNWKDDLKAEAKAQFKTVANSCMQSLKHSVAKYAEYAVKRLFDYAIDCLNSKLSA